MGTEEKRGLRKSQVGTVTSTAMQKTVTVAVDRLVQHKLYKKIQRKTSKFLAHDEDGACKIGRPRAHCRNASVECAEKMASGKGADQRRYCGLKNYE